MVVKRKTKRAKKKTIRASAVKKTTKKAKQAEWSQKDVLIVTTVAVILILAVASFIGYVSVKVMAESGNVFIGEQQAKLKAEKWISEIIKPGVEFEVISVSEQPAYKIMVKITDPVTNSSRVVPHLMTSDGKYLFTEGFQLS